MGTLYTLADAENFPLRTDEVHTYDVTITLIKGDASPDVVIQAATFQFDQDRCLFKDSYGEEVCVHDAIPVRSNNGLLYPWRSAGSNHALEVTFSWAELGDVKVSTFRPKLLTERMPIYTFYDPDGYKIFNSQLRGRRFVREFETKAIASSNEESKNHVIKIWQTESTYAAGPQCLMTVPLAGMDPVRGTRILDFVDIDITWFLCQQALKVLKQPDSFKLVLNLDPAQFIRRPHQRTNSQSSKKSPLILVKTFTGNLNAKRAARAGSIEHASIDKRQFQAYARYKSFNVTFRTTEACAEFLQFHGEMNPTPSDGLKADWQRDSNGSRHGSTASTTPEPSPTFEASDTSSLPTNTPPTIDGTSQRLRPIHRSTLQTPQTIADPGSPASMTPINLPSPGINLDPLDDGLDQAKELRRMGGPTSTNIFQASPKFQENDAVYKKLAYDDEIRLLRVRRARHEENLSCELEHHRLSSCPVYEAVSYCWAETSANIKGIMIGQGESFHVSKHLWEGLKRLRCPDRDRLLWIDAVCINQHNIPEKNHQIPMMQYIYRTAIRTLIWIGERDMSGPNCDRDYPAEGDDPDGDGIVCASISDQSGIEEHTSLGDVKKHLKKFQQELHEKQSVNVWWKRLFVIQEFFYSARPAVVFFGPHSIDWDYFVSIFPAHPEVTDPLQLFKQLQPKESRSLFDLLHDAGDFHCIDHRDRVYGLLSMTPGTMDYIVPDYSQSVLRVLENTCLYLVESSKKVDVLLDSRVDRHMWGAERLRDVFPTWMPDMRLLLSPETVRGLDKFKAGSDQNARVSIGKAHSDIGFDKPRTLTVAGIRFGEIKRRTEQRDLPPYQFYGQEDLIYYSLGIRGKLLEVILDKLEYDEDSHSRWTIERSPGLGRLMLVYLFEDSRSHAKERQRRHNGPQRDVISDYNAQRDKDLRYIETYGKGDRERDRESVLERWRLKIERAQGRDRYEPSRLKKALDKDNETAIEDFEIARDFENLFIYARTSGKRYYFSGDDYDAPMQKDVLDCRTLEEARILPSRWREASREKEADPEYHEYSEKNRERDFFITEDGFLGLGPSCMQTGDVVVVPLGSSRPWILRPAGKQYELVGEAVVHGLMSGRLLTREKDRVEDFVLI